MLWNLRNVGGLWWRSVELRAIESNSVCYECVRWFRKPRWIPIAKSKIFRVSQRVKLPEDELRELRRLNNNYNTNMRSIQHYFAKKTISQTSAIEVIEEQKQKEREEYERCTKENEIWNAEVAKLREERLEIRRKETRDKILQTLIDHEEQQKQLFEQAEAFVRQEKEMSKTFITAKNIDEAIEKALVDHVDYNFAIDKEGNRYIGYRGHPDKTPPRQEISEIKSQAQN